MFPNNKKFVVASANDAFATWRNWFKFDELRKFPQFGKQKRKWFYKTKVWNVSTSLNVRLVYVFLQAGFVIFDLVSWKSQNCFRISLVICNLLCKITTPRFWHSRPMMDF